MAPSRHCAWLGDGVRFRRAHRVASRYLGCHVVASGLGASNGGSDCPLIPKSRRLCESYGSAFIRFGVANLATQMTFAATLHEIAVDWALDASESGWIGGIYFAGYAVAVPFLAS